jgi:hypothetical protein
MREHRQDRSHIPRGVWHSPRTTHFPTLSHTAAARNRSWKRRRLHFPSGGSLRDQSPGGGLFHDCFPHILTICEHADKHGTCISGDDTHTCLADAAAWTRWWPDTSPLVGKHLSSRPMTHLQTALPSSLHSRALVHARQMQPRGGSTRQTLCSSISTAATMLLATRTGPQRRLQGAAPHLLLGTFPMPTHSCSCSYSYSQTHTFARMHMLCTQPHSVKKCNVSLTPQK